MMPETVVWTRQDVTKHVRGHCRAQEALPLGLMAPIHKPGLVWKDGKYPHLNLRAHPLRHVSSWLCAFLSELCSELSVRL